LHISQQGKPKVLLFYNNSKTTLIGVEGAQTSAGGRDKGDPAGLPRRLPDRPQKSEAPGTEINSSE